MEVQMNLENYRNDSATNQVRACGSSQPYADKRLQELRWLALEYVKQIVAKSMELSQQNNNNSTQETAAIHDNHRQQRRPPDQEGAPNDQATMQLIRDASVQINKIFRLDVEARVGSASSPSTNKKTATFARVDQFKCDTTTTTTTLSKRGDYMETDYGTQYEQDNTTTSSGNSNTATTIIRNNNNNNNLNNRQEGNSSGAPAGPARRLKGLHQRLNWHLLVSCFSTCLPESLVDTTTGDRTNNDSGPTSV